MSSVRDSLQSKIPDSGLSIVKLELHHPPQCQQSLLLGSRLSSSLLGSGLQKQKEKNVGNQFGSFLLLLVFLVSVVGEIVARFRFEVEFRGRIRFRVRFPALETVF
jgi:hypothetical protein